MDQLLKQSRKPILVLHSPQDKIVEIKMLKKFIMRHIIRKVLFLLTEQTIYLQIKKIPFMLELLFQAGQDVILNLKKKQNYKLISKPL